MVSMVAMADSTPIVTKPRGRPTKSDAERAKMVAHIAQTAQQLFQEEGYATVSMRRLAKEVGCSPMTLYNYYDGKIAILQTLWGSVFKDVFARVAAATLAAPSPTQRMLHACRAYVQYWLDNPQHYRLVFMAEGVSQPEVNLFIGDEDVAAGFAQLTRYIAEAIGKDRPAGDLKSEIDLVMSALHGIAHNMITISGYPWTEADRMIATLVDKFSHQKSL